MTNASDFDDDDRWLAAEHALGVLDGARRVEAERRVDSDAGFRAEVEGWTTHLAPLLAECVDQVPSAAVWASIRSRLDAESAIPQRRKARPGWWRNLRFWQASTAGALALAAASWMVALTPRTAPVQAPPPPPGRTLQTPVLAASLTPEQGPPLFAVMVDRDREQVAVVPLYAWSPERARQLWVIPADGVPRSLGLIEPGAPTPLPLPPVLKRQTQESVTFAVSDEPQGGSPVPGPSGQVLATGTLVVL